MNAHETVEARDYLLRIIDNEIKYLEGNLDVSDYRDVLIYIRETILDNKKGA